MVTRSIVRVGCIAYQPKERTLKKSQWEIIHIIVNHFKMEDI